jgi:ketosteroid isomerase-like protein
MRTRLGWIAPTAIAALALGMAVSRAAAHTERSGPPSAPVRRPAGPEAAIREVLLTQQTAWNQGDIPAFLEGYWNSPELTFSGSDGTVRGYDGLLERYRKSYPDKAAMGELQFSGLEIRILASDAALVLGHWHLKRVSADVGGVFTLVLRRFPTVGWRIIHDHTSRQGQTP